MTNRLIRFFEIQPYNRRLLFEAFVFLGISRIVLMTMKFKYIVGFLGRIRIDPAGPVETPDQLKCAEAAGAAIETMSRHTVWKSSCFVQALAAKLMLSRRGIHCNISLGLARDSTGKLVAHAWATACGITLTGAAGAENFIVLSEF